ncbi:hypothetical protein SSYRP_v1c03950 [Spiroplasma syrphidicola EA-1]|uniref:Transmembrane protein n=1 Tax=Spiroplasma syrphidicola EA-1 TaxID=1276229 RepID=R4UDK4_9MOLU|nr:hypothetical protein [Spiroplasma syrphidicola]AGM25989.1 hypothetical protein SSYRP_v1c03950 [Spiroplasma syrphidicola EA-1]
MRTLGFGFTRFWIVLSSLFGIIGVLFLAGYYFYFWSNYTNGQITGDLNTYQTLFMNSWEDLGTYRVLFLIIIMFTLTTTLICNIGLIRYATSGTDAELCANKWSLAVLSLSLGGVIAPFALTWLPNTDVKATKNARVTIVRYLGTGWMLGAIGAIIAIGSFMGVTNNSGFVTASAKNTFITVMTILGVVAGFSLLFVPFFYNRKTVDHMIAQTSLGKWYRFVSTVYTVFATILLVIQIISAIVKLIEAFGRIFSNRQNGFQIFLNILNFSFMLIGTMFMIYLITSVIKGLWRSEDDYLISIPQYQRAAQMQQHN